MIEPRRLRRVEVGPVEVVVNMPRGLDDRIRGSALYRLARPAGARVIRLIARAMSSRRPSPVPEAEARTVSPQPPKPEDLDPDARTILDQIAGISWYHTLDLGHGVVTPGFVDHREQVDYYGLPDSLAGMRCLDVAPYDGFWAFEMERRGAAEVVALERGQGPEADIPNVMLPDAERLEAPEPTGAGFRAAQEILGSQVRREVCSIYDLTPDRLGTFDLVFISDLLVHLRDPQLALERVFSVCRDRVIVAEPFDSKLDAFDGVCLAAFTGGFSSRTWWMPNTHTLKAMMHVAGFEPTIEFSRFALAIASDEPVRKIVLHGAISQRHSRREANEKVERRRITSREAAPGASDDQLAGSGN